MDIRTVNYYFLFLLLVCIGCNSSETAGTFREGKATIKLFLAQDFHTRAVDEDNPANEQLVKNISIFLTEPSSATIVEKYVYAGFSFSGDHGLVTISSEPSALLSKDIYVIANYDDEDKLNQMETLDNLRDLFTPEVDKTNNLDPSNGLCMFGSVSNFDFNNQQGNSTTIVLERTCAKFRINLEFVENPGLSITNSYLMQHAAKYTYIIERPSSILPQSEYFNFAAPEALIDNGEQVYTNITYIYEASERPRLTIYTYFNNSTEQQEFTTTLPVPQRNYFYDLFIEIYEDTESLTRSSLTGDNGKYKHKSLLRIYNREGEREEEISYHD